MSEMDQFQKKFIEEATDLINELEDSLLILENNPNDKERISAVFRVMHSLKGSSAMFGFDKIDEFTHNLETIYDQIRNNEKQVNKDILDITFASIDHLKLLLNDKDLTSSQGQIQHQNLLNKINNLISEDIEPQNAIISESYSDNDSEDTKATFYIFFNPHIDVFDNGTNPLFLIDELFDLGSGFSFPNISQIPNLSEIKPTKSYIAWDIFLTTDVSQNEIQDVFIFVEDDCELLIQKVADNNLVDNSDFYNELNKLYEQNSLSDINKIKAVVNKFNLNKIIQEKKQEKITDKEQQSSLSESVSINNGKKSESTISSIRVSSQKIDQMMNLVSELVTTQARLSLFADQSDNGELHAIAENVQKLSRQLRDNAFDISLIPIQNMLTRFQRLVRDLSNELNKNVVFEAEGTETELDKTIIESLTEPMLHILRNSIDHGLESPEERIKANKPEVGKIQLKAFYSGANVHLQISDDGKGIDPEAIRKKAIEKELITQETELSKKEILNLIFLPGFSTAKNITDVSGRGVGMDVVKRKIADIRGEVDLESEFGKGTIITIKLPLTLSIIDGLLVKIDTTNFVIPLSVVEKIYAVQYKDFKNSYNKTVILDEKQVPFHYLRDEFDMQNNVPNQMHVVVVSFEDVKVGLTVDSIVGEYQAVLKPLGRMYKKQDMFSGATILGDGTIALVLDTNKMIKKFSTSKLLNE